MADMGLAGMGGAAGASDTMATLFDQRMKQAQLAQQNQQFQQQLAQQDAMMRLKAQEQAETIRARVEASHQADADRKEAARQHNLALMSTQLNEIPSDTPISGETQGAMTGAGVLPERFAPTPISAPAPPSSIAAPGDSGQPQAMPGTMANSPAPGRVSFHRIPTAQELQKQKEDAAKQGEQDWKNSIAQQLADLKASQPTHPDHFAQLPQFDESGKPLAPLAFDTSTGTARPIPGAGASHAVAGASQAAVKEQDRKETLGDLDQLEHAVDAAKDLIGPGAGRVSSLEQMIGNADPKIQTLGTKMLMTKMRVDRSLGGARAAASPALLARWDNLLGQKVTPEGLKAAIQAMREIVGTGPSGSGPTGKRIVYGMDGKPIQ